VNKINYRLSKSINHPTSIQYINPFFSVYTFSDKESNNDYYIVKESDYVCVALTYQGKVFILHEYKAAYRRVVPNFITGGIEGQEEPVEAAIREVVEETGLNIEGENLNRHGSFLISPNRYFAITHMFSYEVITKEDYHTLITRGCSLIEPTEFDNLYRLQNLVSPVVPSYLSHKLSTHQ